MILIQANTTQTNESDYNNSFKNNKDCTSAQAKRSLEHLHYFDFNNLKVQATELF